MTAVVTTEMLAAVLGPEGGDSLSSRLEACARLGWELLRADGLVGDVPKAEGLLDAARLALGGIPELTSERSRQAWLIVRTACEVSELARDGAADPETLALEAYALGAEVLKAVVSDLGLWEKAHAELRYRQSAIKETAARVRGHAARRFWHDDAVRIAARRRSEAPRETDVDLFDYVRIELAQLASQGRYPKGSRIPSSNAIGKHFSGDGGWFAQGFVPRRILAPSANG